MSDHLSPLRVRARGLVGFAELVAQCDGDCVALLNRAGIAPELLHTPEATLEHGKLVALLELSAQTLDVSDFGLRLAGLQGIAVLGPVALMAQHATTVGEAIAAIGRNMPYHSPGARISLDLPVGADAMACLRYELQLPEGTRHRQNSELAYAIALRFIQMLSAANPEQWRIDFAHPKELTTKQYRRHLGCQLRFGQAFDALYFPQEILGVAIDAADPLLVKMAQRYVAHVIARSPLDLAMQVEVLLIRQLASGGCTLPRIARQLAMSARSLQRRLHLQETSFDEIADRIRKDRAAEYLRHTSLALAQVGSLLGYSESSTFNRSCKRWFGDTPQAYRNAP